MKPIRRIAMLLLICMLSVSLVSCSRFTPRTPDVGGDVSPTPSTIAPTPSAPGVQPVEKPEENLTFPQLDSSTARKDMVYALYSDLVLNGPMTGPEPLCSTTHYAITNLIDGTVDVVFALLPTEEEQAYMDQKGVELEARCYANDALIIVGNVENPVDNLTSEQLRDIYRRKITNWKEVGGPDAEINVFIRDSQSGSQRMFESLVWDGQQDVPDFQDGTYEEMEFREMGEIINMVEATPYSIGYSFLTYVDGEFGASPYLKTFAIDGVYPSEENIANGSYPFISTAWMLIRADAPADSPARWMFDWFTYDNAKPYITGYTSSIPSTNDPILLKAR